MSADDRTQTAGTIRATGEASEQEATTPVCVVCKSTKGGECEHCFDPSRVFAAQVAPHGFRPLGILDKIGARNRCAACFLPRKQHPARFWSDARPVGDTSAARVAS